MSTTRSRSKLPAATRRTAKPKAKAVTSRSKAQTTSKNKASTRTSRSAQSTTDHDEIQQWVESHGGHPATVKRTTRGNQAAGVLRIDFPGFSGKESLKEISWDEWFQVFDQRKLAFLYQDAQGKQSRFNKLVSRSGAKTRAKR